MEKVKSLRDLISRMKAASKRAKKHESLNIYYRKGETVSRFSHCQGPAKCNAFTFSRKPKNN